MRQHVRWRTHMAQIRPYYTVRCNSSPTVIEVLAALGTGFICANKVLIACQFRFFHRRKSKLLYAVFRLQGEQVIAKLKCVYKEFTTLILQETKSSPVHQSFILI